MEATPTPPRQRNRRSDRYLTDRHPAPTANVLSQSPTVNPQAVQSDDIHFNRRIVPYDDRPVTAYARSETSRFADPNTPVPTPRALQRPSQGERPVQARQEDARVARRTIRSSHSLEETVPEEAETPEEDDKRLPWYLSTAMVLLLLLVMSLFAAQNLMQAYLKTQADERAAAHQALLDNYHVLDNGNGTASVTYQAFIERYAAEYNLQPAFVTAIIRNESSFRRDAESSVGARGLMQMMPDTAEWIAGKLRVENFSFDSMYDPETNIRFGCWYLNYLAKLFRGDPTLVTAAYHTGQTTVTRWLSDRSMSADGRTIKLDDMMDGPTKTYVGRVTLAYGIYHSLLYPNQPLHGTTYAVSAADGAAGTFALARR